MDHIPKYPPRIRVTEKGAQLLDKLLDEHYTAVLKRRYAARQRGEPIWSLSPETTEINRIRVELFDLAEERGWDLDVEPFGPDAEGASPEVSTGA